MSRPLKLTLVVGGAFVGLLALAVAGVLLLVNESRLEAFASEAVGMEVDVRGRTGIGLFPLHVTLQDVHLRNRGVDVLAAEQADFGIDFLPLLALNVRFRNIAVERYRISIERGLDGNFNYEPEDPQRVLLALDLADVSFSDGTLQYADLKSGNRFEVTGCNLELTHVSHPGGKPSDFLAQLSVTMEFVCAEMRRDNLVWSDLQGSLNGRDGIFTFEPVTMRVFGGQGAGSVQVDRSGAVPRVQARYSLLQLRIEEFLQLLSPERVAHGLMDLTMNLTMQGSTWNELRQTADGSVSLVGQDLVLDGRDLDAELSRYEDTQHFNLVDVGALFLAGPLGLAVTKGYDFASLFRGSGGSTPIPTLVSHWKVERGVAHAEDVALATRENRLALRGGLDFVDGEFEDVTVAQVDARGCTKVRQRIVGPFLKPVVEQPNFLRSMAGPAIKLSKQIRKLFPGGECREVFYEGSVAPPAPPAAT